MVLSFAPVRGAVEVGGGKKKPLTLDEVKWRVVVGLKGPPVLDAGGIGIDIDPCWWWWWWLK